MTKRSIRWHQTTQVVAELNLCWIRIRPDHLQRAGEQNRGELSDRKCHGWLVLTDVLIGDIYICIGCVWWLNSVGICQKNPIRNEQDSPHDSKSCLVGIVLKANQDFSNLFAAGCFHLTWLFLENWLGFTFWSRSCNIFEPQIFGSLTYYLLVSISGGKTSIGCFH